MKKFSVSELVGSYLVGIFFLFLLNAFVFFIFPIIFWFVNYTLIILVSFLIYIFRTPKLLFPSTGTVISPTDGKLLSIENNKVIILCNIFDKFMKYAPIDGTITNLIFFAGEKNHGKIEITIQEKNGLEITMLLISQSFYKIFCLVKQGDKVQKGDELFFIPLRSEIHITFNKNVNLLPKANSKLLACFSHLCLQ